MKRGHAWRNMGEKKAGSQRRRMRERWAAEDKARVPSHNPNFDPLTGKPVVPRPTAEDVKRAAYNDARDAYPGGPNGPAGIREPEVSTRVLRQIQRNASRRAGEIEASKAEGRAREGTMASRALYEYKRQAEKAASMRLERINARRVARGRKPLTGHPGDKPGHPFRGNQYGR